MRDREVVASIVAGDPTGLAAAYDKYADALYGYARSFLREPADAADVVHDTFVIAAASLSQLRDPERLRPWLYAVARSLCLRRLRATKAAAIYVAPEDIPEDIGEDADAVSETERAELRALLRAAGGGLNPGERDIVELRLWQGLDAAEAAAALGITRGHAHALLSRGRDQLTASVAALLVARTGRGDCGELDQILSGWDGQLTVLMRKRLSRHIERCDICSDRRRRELRPALLVLWPAGAGVLAGATMAERALHAGSIPMELRAQVLQATSGPSVHAAATAAGLGGQVRMARQNGFPQPGAPRPLTLSRAVLRRGTHSRMTLWSAAGAAAVLVGTGVFLSTYFLGHPGKTTGAAAGLAQPITSSGPGSTGSAPGSPGGQRGPGSGGSGAPGAAGGSGGSAGPGGSGGSGGRVVPVVTLKRGPGTSPAPGSSTGSTAPGGGSSSGAGGAPTSSSSGPASTAPTTTPASTAPTTSAPTPSPTSAPTTSSPPPSTAAGTLSVSPTSVVLTPLLGSTLTLTAENGPVSWSISEPASLLGELNVSPSSGALAAGQSVTVSISVSGLASLDTTLTVNPGGQAVTVLLGLGL
jgi:RNA polymerase sigma factor (sigma-70 family)